MKVLLLVIIIISFNSYAQNNKKFVLACENGCSRQFAANELNFKEKIVEDTDSGEISKEINFSILDSKKKLLRNEKIETGSPVGGTVESLGLHFPKQQISKDVFLFAVTGGYNTRLFIVNKQGELHVIPLGFLYFNKKDNQLLSFQAGGADSDSLDVVSLSNIRQHKSFADSPELLKINTENHQYDVLLKDSTYYLQARGNGNELSDKKLVLIDGRKMSISQQGNSRVKGDLLKPIGEVFFRNGKRVP